MVDIVRRDYRHIVKRSVRNSTTHCAEVVIPLKFPLKLSSPSRFYSGSWTVAAASMYSVDGTMSKRISAVMRCLWRWRCRSIC